MSDTLKILENNRMPSNEANPKEVTEVVENKSQATESTEKAEIKEKAKDNVNDLQKLQEQIQSYEKQIKDTKSWGNKANQEKVALYKKLKEVAEAGHIDESELQNFNISTDDPLAGFWDTVEKQVNGYSSAFGQEEPKKYLASFKHYLRELSNDNAEEFNTIEQDLTLLSKDDWTRYVVDKGKQHYNDFYQHLGGKSTKQAYLDLLKDKQKLEQKLEKMQTNVMQEDTPQVKTSRPILNGGGVQDEPSMEPRVSTESLLNNFRKHAFASR